jgi:hypothetical protein
MAIEAALRTGHIHRMGMPPRGLPGMPEREWRPKTYGEWFNAIETYLAILAPLLRDPDAPVRIAAIGVGYHSGWVGGWSYRFGSGLRRAL